MNAAIVQAAARTTTVRMRMREAIELALSAAVSADSGPNRIHGTPFAEITGPAKPGSSITSARSSARVQSTEVTACPREGALARSARATPVAEGRPSGFSVFNAFPQRIDAHMFRCRLCIALLRLWHSNVAGIIAPHQFIPQRITA